MKLSDSGGQGERQRQPFDRELRNMISALTQMGADKPGSSHLEDEDEHGVRVITLSGSNIGATMKTELDGDALGDSDSDGNLDFLSTFVNSNFQAVNNSIMMGGKYETHDPGVHLDISGDTEKPFLPKESRAKKGKVASRNNRRDSEHTD
ncbi:PREDICTED: uncharacterized protein LOC104798386 [Tarenaya hassleriana]|uniref:uncharacterized protein LOC104798383 n=1 Tax=Tarenaya hassleriana TaxID=28532 RepID=UPI00053C38E4|nr:PREDICTED: uncharacterized protein LOC104798383 [Tarenaya hassleriana]XP_010518749.1 PREDICTED: uncharacterized protein LOC104798386 [Tarenaya hassleriana]